MTDLVVTVPRNLWSEWIDEGDAVGEPETGEEWGFFLGPAKPPIKPGERLYIVSHDRLRGYAPVTRVAFFPAGCATHQSGTSAFGLALGAALLHCDVCRGVFDGIEDRPRQNGQGVPGRWAIGRQGGAVAVTIKDHVRGFRGWRARWWSRADEVPFPDWATTDLWLNRTRAKAQKTKAQPEAKPQGELFCSEHEARIEKADQ